MSLAATLLGVPGLIKRLRGHNAPATPLGLTGSVDVAQDPYAAFATGLATWKPALRTHQVLDHVSLNNATSLAVPVASLTGKGAFDGVWVKMTLPSSNTVTCTYGVEIIVDGVDIAPTGYSHTLTAAVSNRYYASVSAAVGGAAITSAYIPYPTNLWVPSSVFERASVPIPFNSSLEVNLVHVSSTAAVFRTSCWVNAWLTE